MTILSIDFLNSKKGFQKDTKLFKGSSYEEAYQKAKKWANKTFDEFHPFHPDMINIVQD